MSLVLTDSFSFYSSVGDIGSRWDEVNNLNGRITYDPTGGQFGTGAATIGTQSNSAYIRYSPSLSDTSYGIGVRFTYDLLQDDLEDGVSILRARSVMNWGDEPGEFCTPKETEAEVDLRVNEDGSLTVVVDPFSGATNTDPSRFYSDPVFRSEAAYYYIEIDFAPGPSFSGTVYVNDKQVLSYSRSVTHSSDCVFEGSYIDYIDLISEDNQVQIPSFNATFEDAYISSAGVPRLGPCRSRVRRPTADVSTDFIPQGGGGNWEEVDEKQADDDTTYNQGDQAGDRDTFEFEDVSPAPPEILVAAFVHRAKQMSTGFRELEAVLNGSVVGQKLSVEDSYKYLTHIFKDNPETGAAWQNSELNAAQGGYEME